MGDNLNVTDIYQLDDGNFDNDNVDVLILTLAQAK